MTEEAKSEPNALEEAAQIHVEVVEEGLKSGFGVFSTPGSGKSEEKGDDKGNGDDTAEGKNDEEGKK